MQRSDLPFGSEFSPSQIDLPRVLEMANAAAGDWKAFEAAVRREYFEAHATSDYNRGKLANNTKLGMIAYGIIDRDANLSDLGQRLFSARHNEPELYRVLGRHILLNLHGAAVVQCVKDMQSAGEEVTLVSLRRWLEDRGVHFPSGGKHPSIMRLWLEKAGVFASGWRVAEAAFHDLLGVSSDELDVLAQLNQQQRAYLKSLINIGGDGPYPSNDVARLAAATYGVAFNEKNLPKEVLYPLQDAGYITLDRGTREAGRGAKPFHIRPTEKLIKDVIDPLLDQLDKQIALALRPLLRKPLTEILTEIESDNRHIRGLALEALAFKLMRLIDLTYVATRLRGSATGGAEVDVIFESDRLVFSRWQVQCKNTAQVSLDDVAKEVGLTHLLKSNVIVMVSTGRIGTAARSYANTIMRESNLCVVMVDRDDILAIASNPIGIVDILHREARHAMTIKRLDMEEGRP
ncbi:MAG TPA: restriction endonuclease [Chloroflexota bacterium]|nr:restriction endonuclease [Chloroflexota bacterium]